METICIYFVIFIVGYIAGRSVAYYKANKAFSEFKASLKKFGHWPS